MRSERKEILSGKGIAHFGRVIVGSLEKGTKALWYRLGPGSGGKRTLKCIAIFSLDSCITPWIFKLRDRMTALTRNFSQELSF